MISRLAAASVATFCWTSSVLAGGIVDAAIRAENALAKGKTVEALASIETATQEVWDAIPLTIVKALFVSARPTGFGAYQERASKSYRLGEPILVYAEPVGFGYRADGAFNWIDLTADFEIRTSTGQSLGGQEDFGDFRVRSRYRNREFHIFLSYTFNGLQPGEYVLITTLKDRVTGRSASFELPFTTVE